MTASRLVDTTAGPVEVVVRLGDLPPVLVLPGGHCTAASDCGWSLYRELGHGIVSVSRPGYGRTAVGPLTAAAFVPVLAEVLERTVGGVPAAAVGVSFGGLQAAHLAAARPDLVPRLALHSCAPSTHPYPDTRAERVGGPVVFGPAAERLVWAGVRRVVAGDHGLRTMVGALSRRPVRDWWDSWTPADRAAARALFRSMRSGSGFALDLRQATPAGAVERARTLAAVTAPTLVTGSRDDAGVDFRHAEDLAARIPGAHLLATDAPSHLFWLGPEARQLTGPLRTLLDTPVTGREPTP